MKRTGDKIHIDNPFLLAPMAGITDAPFRLICRELGAALTVTEMVSAKGLWYNDRKSFDLLRHSEAEGPVSFQLFGSDPEIMAEAVERIEERTDEFAPAMYDINMGCPVPKVVRNGEGSALMNDPEMAGRIVESMCAKTGRPVTVKMRIGWDKDSVNAVSFAGEMEAAGAAAVCVHGRTRAQFYEGKADWNVIGEVRAAVRIPVYGSGDVFSGSDAVRMIRETGCDAVMAARGALGNPWIFRDALMLQGGATEEEVIAAVPGIEERAAMFIRQAKLTTEAKGEYIAVREMRKHAGWYFKGKPGVQVLRNTVNQAGTVADLIKTVEEYVDGNRFAR
ncbi:MAG: tRNA dihydrouridine synthase DusB [Clostridiales Family XIII bacterium]|jgi:tRNA-dihydrouridine synthase B|nr:tRNA dihydrouridine synthase DusB [Clostridiales Family XIII bacterium]